MGVSCWFVWKSRGSVWMKTGRQIFRFTLNNFSRGFHFLRALSYYRGEINAQTTPKLESQTGARQVFAAKIDWRKNDSSLIEGFASWLRRERPKSIPSMALIGGRQSVYDSLNALSALRLRHLFSIEDAIRHTKSVLRKPLYRDRSSWDRAQRRAIQLFTKEFPGAGSPKSETRISNRKTPA